MDTTYRAAWSDTCATATTTEERTCVAEAEENANASAFEQGFECFTEPWYRNALSSYEFLMDAGVYT